MAPTSAIRPSRKGTDVLSELVRWRFVQLRRSGYPEDVATELAARLDIDLHQATSLIEAGCPATTALRILL